VPWLLIEGQQKMLVNFAMVIRVTSIPKTWQIKQLFDVLLSHNNRKRNP
jgi:arginine decarboxylase-like protein